MDPGQRHNNDEEPENPQQPDDESSEPEIIDETEGGSQGRQLVRKKIRVRKRIRIRKKPSSKKKLKKWGERLLWLTIIAAFIAALIVMIVELDVRDEKFKQRKPAKKPGGKKVSTY